MTALGDFLGKWGTSSCSLCKSPPCRVSFFSFMGGMLVGEQSHSKTPALVSALGQSANRVGLSPQHWLFLLHLESRLILLESLSRMCRGIGKLPTSLPPPLNKERKKESEVTQLCPTLCDPMDCSLPGSSVHGIFQARELEWVAISFSRGSSWPRDRTQVSHTVSRHLTVWATREALSTKTTPIQINKLIHSGGLSAQSFHEGDFFN